MSTNNKKTHTDEVMAKFDGLVNQFKTITADHPDGWCQVSTKCYNELLAQNRGMLAALEAVRGIIRLEQALSKRGEWDEILAIIDNAIRKAKGEL